MSDEYVANLTTIFHHLFAFALQIVSSFLCFILTSLTICNDLKVLNEQQFVNKTFTKKDISNFFLQLKPSFGMLVAFMAKYEQILNPQTVTWTDSSWINSGHVFYPQLFLVQWEPLMEWESFSVIRSHHFNPLFPHHFKFTSLPSFSCLQSGNGTVYSNISSPPFTASSFHSLSPSFPLTSLARSLSFPPTYPNLLSNSPTILPHTSFCLPSRLTEREIG